MRVRRVRVRVRRVSVRRLRRVRVRVRVRRVKRVIMRVRAPTTEEQSSYARSGALPST